jgi:hypothetical protein
MSTLMNAGMTSALTASARARGELMGALEGKASPETVQLKSLLAQEANANLNAAASTVKGAIQTTQTVSRPG